MCFFRPDSPKALGFHFCDTIKVEEDECDHHPEVHLPDHAFWEWADVEAQKIRALIKANKPQ